MIVMLCDETGETRPYDGYLKLIEPVLEPVSFALDDPPDPIGGTFRRKVFNAVKVMRPGQDTPYEDAEALVKDAWNRGEIRYPVVGD